jgi:hypothetical protein
MQRKVMEMDVHMQMMEKMTESNEKRFKDEMNAELEKRKKLEDELNEEKKSKKEPGDLKERELMVRARELVLAEKRQATVDEMNEEGELFESSVSISDPAADVLCDLSMLRPLEEKLKNVKASVSTIVALLDKLRALAEHVDLREILAGVEMFSVKFVVQKFKIKFQSLFKISKVTLSVVSTLVMGKVNRNKATAATKYGGSKSIKQLTRDAQIAKKSSSVPVMELSMKKEKFTDLLGIKLLRETTDREQVAAHWDAIEEFVGAIVFFVSDVKGKLAAATQNVEMFRFEDKRMDDIDEVICEFDELFDICTSWLGSEFEGEYQKIQRFLKKCPAAVQEEYALFISPKLDGERVDELTMNWAEFCNLIKKVWESSFLKKNIRAEFGLPDGPTKVAEDKQANRMADHRQQMRVTIERPSDVDGDDFKVIN